MLPLLVLPLLHSAAVLLLVPCRPLVVMIVAPRRVVVQSVVADVVVIVAMVLLLLILLIPLIPQPSIWLRVLAVLRPCLPRDLNLLLTPSVGHAPCLLPSSCCP